MIEQIRNGKHLAANYAPLPVVADRAEGVWVWDREGRKYLDMLGAYSAVSFGHSHPVLVEALRRQASRLDTVSRAIQTDILGKFIDRACELTGYARGLPMNTGAEAVETAIKAARRWGYEVKGIPDDKAEIICCAGNFHGRTIAATAMSTVPAYRSGFGPFPPGFVTVPFGDAKSLAAAITPNTAAFLVEPIQGEGGIGVPPPGYLADAARICRDNGVLFIADEVQSGLGRTGHVLASWHENVKPDAVTLGKALGGGLVPVSLFLAGPEIMEVMRAGEHGSTFGGNPIAAAVGYEALGLLQEYELCRRASEAGEHLFMRLRRMSAPLIKEVRGRGLFAGIEIDRAHASAADVVLAFASEGVLAKETHRNTVRLAPPLTISLDELDYGLDRIEKALATLS
ncbi:MAG: hypothetical protein RLZ98_1333 [Pseudomonadota bacterium]|jgi:ornithine--oxo-acid transaminase